MVVLNAYKLLSSANREIIINREGLHLLYGCELLPWTVSAENICFGF